MRTVRVTGDGLAFVVLPFAFKILVDLNEITVGEAARASEFTADGVWAIELWATGPVDWPATYKALNANAHSIVEGTPSEAAAVAVHLGYAPDAMMEESEGQPGDNTVLSDELIAAYAAADLGPGYGTLRKKIVVMARSYRQGDSRRAAVDHALLNPDVIGVAFEFAAVPEYAQPLAFDEGVEACAAAGKRCYFLMPPRSPSTDYEGDVIRTLAAIRPDLSYPLLYIVPAAYGRAVNGVTFAGSTNSIAAAVAALKQLRTQGGTHEQPQARQATRDAAP